MAWTFTDPTNQSWRHVSSFMWYQKLQKRGRMSFSIKFKKYKSTVHILGVLHPDKVVTSTNISFFPIFFFWLNLNVIYRIAFWDITSTLSFRVSSLMIHMISQAHLYSRRPLLKQRNINIHFLHYDIFYYQKGGHTCLSFGVSSFQQILRSALDFDILFFFQFWLIPCFLFPSIFRLLICWYTYIYIRSTNQIFNVVQCKLIQQMRSQCCCLFWTFVFLCLYIITKVFQNSRSGNWAFDTLMAIYWLFVVVFSYFGLEFYVYIQYISYFSSHCRIFFGFDYNDFMLNFLARFAFTVFFEYRKRMSESR